MNIEIADRLVKLRKEHNLSQEALASKLGLSRQAVSKWERAEASPDTDNLVALAELYGVPLDEILNGPKAQEDTPNNEQTKESLIFPLPSYESCSKSLRRWVKRAGIDKHISWHCARHSFATNILTNGANIKTVASLLGHSGLKHTEKYVRAVDKLKEEAICSLPDINF